MAADPAALEGYLAALNAFGRSTALSAVEQQLVLIAASATNSAAYSIAVHSSVARGLGASVPAIEAAATGTPVADARLAALLSLAAAITRGRGQVSDAVITRARAAGLGAAEIVAVSFGVALKAFANAVALIGQPQIDPGFAAPPNAG